MFYRLAKFRKLRKSQKATNKEDEWLVIVPAIFFGLLRIKNDRHFDKERREIFEFEHDI